MFDVDELVGECVAAGSETEPRLAVRDALTRALARADDVAASLRPSEGGISLLHHTPDLTVIHVVWAPGMRLFPHNHLMWAAIGIYVGQEDNTFYRRSGAGERTLDESGGKELTVGDVLLLGDDTIHAVANPTRRLTGAIHVYGGDFVNQPRSQWGPGPCEERPYSMDAVDEQFAEANRAWHATTAETEHFVPLTAAYLADDGDVVVPYDKTTIKRAPRADEHVISSPARAELAAYYGTS